MEQMNNTKTPNTKTTSKKGFKHLTRSKRDTIEALFRSGMTDRDELARIIDVHPTTIYRELKRGAVINFKSSLEEYETYSAEAAQQRANEASAAKGPRPTITTGVAKKLVPLLVDEKRSPADALAVLKDQGETDLPCFKTVYNAIHAKDLPILISDLPYRRSERKREPYPQRRKAYTARTNTSIEEWTKEIKERLEIGHLEIDLVMGRRGTKACLLTAADRKTRRLYIERLPRATQDEVEKALKRIRERIETEENASKIESLTSDNGSQLIDEKAMRKATGADVFYAHPYSAWERGTNENANRIVRRFIPKGAVIKRYSKAKIRAIETHINSIHRDVLGGLTAQQAHEKETNKQKVA